MGCLLLDMLVHVMSTMPWSELELAVFTFFCLSVCCLGCDDSDEDDEGNNTCLDLELERDLEPITGDFLRSVELAPPVMVRRKLLRDLT